MTEPIDLFPGTRPNRWALLEHACEVIETWPGSFSHRDIHKALGSFPPGSGAARQAVKVLLSHGLIVRIGHSAATTRYIVHPAHKAVAV